MRSLWLVSLYFILVALDVLFKDYHINWLIHNNAILLGVVFWFVYGTTIQKDSINRLLLLISEYSFGIYLFHQLTLNCINKAYAKFIPPSSVSQLFGYFVIPSIVIVGCVLFSIFLKKHAKRLYCALFGKRIPIQGKLH